MNNIIFWLLNFVIYLGKEEILSEKLPWILPVLSQASNLTWGWVTISRKIHGQLLQTWSCMVGFMSAFQGQIQTEGKTILCPKNSNSKIDFILFLCFESFLACRFFIVPKWRQQNILVCCVCKNIFLPCVWCVLTFVENSSSDWDVERVAKRSPFIPYICFELQNDRMDENSVLKWVGVV